jgi:hypothetical protein
MRGELHEDAREGSKPRRKQWIGAEGGRPLLGDPEKRPSPSRLPPFFFGQRFIQVIDSCNTVAVDTQMK